MVDSEEKNKLLAKFSAYLDEAPVDINQSKHEEVDLFRLFTELAALKTEVKIESRQVKKAIEEFQVLTKLLQDNNERLNKELAKRQERTQELVVKTEKPFLLGLIDLRDRIAAGTEQALPFKPAWISHFDERARTHIKILQQGSDISLRRLDGLLMQYKVKPIDAVGKPLDPYTMQVSDTEQRFGVEDGIVLKETRKGYLRNDSLLRIAEVTVNKNDRELI